MKPFVFIIPLIVFALSGCVSDNAAGVFQITEEPVSRPQANTTGAYPTFDADPKGQTDQLNALESEKEKADLRAAAAKGQAQAARSNEQSYQAEIREMQRLQKLNEARRKAAQADE